MTKKDFKTVAEIISVIISANDFLGKDARSCMLVIDHYLKENNSNYDAKKFWSSVERKVLEFKGIITK